ncbi:2,5-dichloro-2,5-cyclohexadiene-1,4-diol dehydrogenase [Planctomycetes bacterium CA13]|uniref:2,5-dichloro-2,5-cyclohexadiene-1,4-diol dehydrogenase n=1 Tax=Novipirellula herctigrandis TaxID=2527986 RepID=A0A5C5Z3N5_9BACT|nr:2,5-dichloro-2,5-cyclohexadiene-1,4-diol dehydrogenase [Planctomycetes bacterium CA13]
MSLLVDKSIVIIGGTTGLGLSAAKTFVDEGASVVIVGRDGANAAAATEAIGGKAVSFVGDAIESDTAPSAIGLSLSKFGRFDGLYHVAGGSGRSMGDGPLHEITDEGWQYTVDLNLTSLFKSNRAAVVQFLKQGSGGSILNMGSVLGHRPSPKYFASHTYAATKSAINGFTRSIAAYYAKDNIRINVLAPALVETPMSQRASQDDTIQSFIATKQPLDGGRNGKASDLDAAAVYFMSDGSRFTTGQQLNVDGGWSVSEGQWGRLQ